MPVPYVYDSTGLGDGKPVPYVYGSTGLGDGKPVPYVYGSTVGDGLPVPYIAHRPVSGEQIDLGNLTRSVEFHRAVFDRFRFAAVVTWGFGRGRAVYENCLV